MHPMQVEGARALSTCFVYPHLSRQNAIRKVNIMKDNRSQLLPRIVPVLWTVAGLIWLATFLLDLCKDTNPPAMVVLHGIAAALGLILIAVSWLRYFRDRNSQNR